MASVPRILGFALVLCLAACTDPRAATMARLAEDHCDRIDLARGEGLIYFSVARDQARTNAEAPGSADLTVVRNCNDMLELLAAGNGFIAGYNSMATPVAGALEWPIAFVDGHKARTSDARDLCMRGQTAPLLELLGEFERSVGADFDRHLATCREHGWRPIEERLAGPPAKP